MKGIILAGGSGTRLGALTIACSKQLLPVYDKPVIYYPLHTLLLAGIRDILIISTPRDTPRIRDLLKDGVIWGDGIRLSYAVQPEPSGIAQALIIGEEFINRQPVCLILGDNLFFGRDVGPLLRKSVELINHRHGAQIFVQLVSDPRRFGVATFDYTGLATSIEEKPTNPRSKWAVTGLYMYDSTASIVAGGILPGPRGELEITDVNRHYMQRGCLHVTTLGPMCNWMDVGTPDALLAASLFVHQEGGGFP